MVARIGGATVCELCRAAAGAGGSRVTGVKEAAGHDIWQGVAPRGMKAWRGATANDMRTHFLLRHAASNGVIMKWRNNEKQCQYGGTMTS
jgi:hypothetical protein